jgi:hypothetical protein
MQPRRRLTFRLAMVGVVLAPAVTAAIGLALERSEARAQREKLERVPLMVVAWDPKSCEPVAAREGVIIAHLNMQGEAIFRTGPVRLARGPRRALLDTADGELPPWSQREEVRAALGGNRTFGQYWVGSVLVQTLAQPRPEGGAVYVVTGAEMELRRPHLGLQVAAGEIFLILVLLVVGVRLRPRAGPGAKP